jgi:hypothetical protein
VLSGLSTRRFSLAVSPSFASDRRIAATDGSSLYLSRDGGTNYEHVAHPFAEDITALAFDNRGRLFAAAFSVLLSGEFRGGLAVTSDYGRTWRMLGDDSTPFAAGVVAVTPLPDGRILAAPQGHGGLWCSVDDGATWHPRCPA